MNGDLRVLYCVEVWIDADLNFSPFKFIVAGLTVGGYAMSVICCTSRQKLTKYGAKKLRYFSSVCSVV